MVENAISSCTCPVVDPDERLQTNGGRVAHGDRQRHLPQRTAESGERCQTSTPSVSVSQNLQPQEASGGSVGRSGCAAMLEAVKPFEAADFLQIASELRVNRSIFLGSGDVQEMRGS